MLTIRNLLLVLLILPELAYGYLSCSRLQTCEWWGGGEYLLTWRKQRFYPPLVTTSDAADEGILGQPSTTILFGDECVDRSPRSGGRGDAGFWITRDVGFGATYYDLGREKVDFDIESGLDGEPVFARPFNNSGAQTSDLLSSPGVQLFGLADVDTNNTIWGGDLYVRYRMLCFSCLRLDLLGGFRFIRLDDDLDISTRTTSGLILPATVDIADHFNATNDYYSGLIGFVGELRSQCWALNVVGKVGLGNMIKKIDISGQTITEIIGIETITPVGLLAHPGNINKHSFHQFEVVPEINAKLELRLWPHFWVTAGYQYMFWPRIILAGEQVNLDVDAEFVRHDTSFWAQGLTAGFHFLF